MARLIVKSPYIKCGGGNSAGGYMRYIATRERVELIQDDCPPTRKQEQLIAKLVKDFPDARELDEYADYQEHPTKANASTFISQALEENWSDVQKSDGYMKYIAMRPRAERLGSHGLFGDKDGVELDRAMAELENYTGNVWTHIISLKREDAERLGYDNAGAWRTLLRAHRNDIAAAMNIPPQDFCWYAAFHDEGDHPHVHTSVWNGNVAVCGHNRGAKYVIGSIKNLDVGDKITYTTSMGTRTYLVETVTKISSSDWSYLSSTTDNRMTLLTCVAGDSSQRWCVQAVQAS